MLSCWLVLCPCPYDTLAGTSVAGELPRTFQFPGAEAGRAALQRLNDTNSPFASTNHAGHPRVRVRLATSAAECAGGDGFGKGNHFVSPTGWTPAEGPEIGPLALAECAAQAHPAVFGLEDSCLVEVFVLEVPAERAFSQSHSVSTILVDQLFEQPALLSRLDFLGVRDMLLSGQDVETHFPEERIPLGRMDTPGF